jgi:thioredoxin 1
MAGKNVVTITDQNFEELVTGNKGIVLVDCWASWCGPCVALTPTIEALADEYAGKVVVGKLNVDENRKVPSQFRITSIPTVLVFKGGVQVDAVVGARPKQYYKDLIDKKM